MLPNTTIMEGEMSLKVEHALHMVGGTGETSYVANSRLQEKAIHQTKSLLAIAVEETYKALHSDQMVVVDLGCSSGPNTLLMLSHVLSVATKLPRRMELQFFLNDLPGNDFNCLFQSLEGFKKRLEGEIEGDLLVPYYVAGVAGSFYGRLFPRASVHLFHSSFCLMWLSQVPEGLKIEHGVPLNKGNIYWTETSLAKVEKAYQEQFQKDFSTFLKLRHTELNVGGRMVLVFVGRRKRTPGNGDFVHLYGLLGEALNSMVLEGIIQEEKVDTFNLPIYGASFEEVESVIHNEGVFDLDRAEIFESSWDPFDDSKDDIYAIPNYMRSGKNVANYIRAVVEPLIVHQFGTVILDDLFARYAHLVSKHLLKKKANHTILVFALKKKA
uniref:Benzoic acid/salicylic acid carboxyl methyltransferase 1 n=1 Tax=Hedychium coronarium TaxID=71610 RepID=A0A8A6IHG0_HEDCO|nr:benzoic acid/salicylic acid carboxyl methyltransferase 1 [Hedychium coronarium]